MAKFIVQTLLSIAIISFGCWNLTADKNKEWASSAIAYVLGLWFESPSIVKRSQQNKEQ